MDGSTEDCLILFDDSKTKLGFQKSYKYRASNPKEDITPSLQGSKKGYNGAEAGTVS